MEDLALYTGREATWVKHRVLRQYLEKLAYKIGWWCGTINYVDGFAGPWKARAEDLSDTSPHIAIRELRAAREGIATAGRTPPFIRCLFVERDADAFQRLRESVSDIHDIRVNVLQGDFEQRISDALAFTSQVSGRSFTFFFIDPTGWTGFGMNAIAPILRHRPGEVLINFMTKDIKRFIDDETSDALPTFVDLFGSENYRHRWQGLSGQDREDAIVDAYCQRVKIVGGFDFVASAVVLHPTDQRTHFHLIYGTRSQEGLRTFRTVEAKTMEAQERARALAQQTKRETASQQRELFSADVIGSGSYYDKLRERSLSRSRAAILALLETQHMVKYDELEAAALSMPMTWHSDVQGWLQIWKRDGFVRFEGLAPRERTLKPDSNHVVIWLPG